MLLVSDPSFGPCGLGVLRRQTARAVGLTMDETAPASRDERHQEQTRLLLAVARGDRPAYTSLFSQLAGPLYCLAYRLLGDAGDAQDLVQDIFLQVWRTAATYEAGRGTVFAWLATLTRNRAIDRIRMKRRRSELLAHAGPELQLAATAGETDSAGTLWLREKAAAVRTALAELTPDQRQALELAYFSGLTQQEIAARLNEPLGTIKARIRRGLLRLKDRLPARL